MEDTMDYQRQRIKALEEAVGRLAIEKDQLKETIRELCSGDELPDGYKEIILKGITDYGK
jgi:mRNA-degrading endonuclease YafQ of YafQ-DinJ toxin-antitoxin module